MRPRPNTTGYRRETLWRAAMVHRISGVVLALFLPAHFLVLGLAIQGEERLDGFLKWTENPLVKAAETLLILALAVHLLGGLRVLLIEMAPWEGGQRQRALIAVAVAIVIAACFLIAAIL